MSYMPDALVKEYYHHEQCGADFRKLFDEVIEEFGNPKDLSADPVAAKGGNGASKKRPMTIGASDASRKKAKISLAIEDAEHVPGEQTKYVA